MQVEGKSVGGGLLSLGESGQQHRGGRVMAGRPGNPVWERKKEKQGGGKSQVPIITGGAAQTSASLGLQGEGRASCGLGLPSVPSDLISAALSGNHSRLAQLRRSRGG